MFDCNFIHFKKETFKKIYAYHTSIMSYILVSLTKRHFYIFALMSESSTLFEWKVTSNEGRGTCGLPSAGDLRNLTLHAFLLIGVHFQQPLTDSLFYLVTNLTVCGWKQVCPILLYMLQNCVPQGSIVNEKLIVALLCI